MNEIQKRFQDLLAPGQQGQVIVIDILLVTFLVYRLLKLIRGIRAWRVVLGIVVFIVALGVTDLLDLKTVHWLLIQATALGPVALAIVFLPELRQAVEGFARLGNWTERLVAYDDVLGGNALEEIVAAVAEMAEQRTGALIVIERSTKLDDVAANGVMVKAQVTAPLLAAIFNEGSPLHDGAVIVRQGQLLAAACRLPLSESSNIDSHYHMRHRAGVGISEQSDSLVVLVSEERGKVSAALNGKLINVSTGKELRELLNHELRAGLGKKRGRRRGDRPASKSNDSGVEKVG